MPDKSNISPLEITQTYLITGKDDFKKKDYLTRLNAKLLGKDADIFNYSLYHARECKIHDVIDFLETFSATLSALERSFLGTVKDMSVCLV